MILDLFRLDGKVAVISGGGKGIGAAIALAMAEAGADIAIGARTAADLDGVAAQVEALGRRSVTVAADLSTREGMQALVDAAVGELGGIDIVVNNVGGTPPIPFPKLSERAFRHAFDWNVTTAFNLSSLAVPYLLERPGSSIINIASAAGRFANRGFTAYSTAKAAMIQLTHTMAQELNPKVRVNAIAPGAIETDALGTVLNDEIRAAMVAGTPLRRLGRVDDIAAAAVYLASEAGSYVTGQCIPVDGGIQGSNLPIPFPDL